MSEDDEIERLFKSSLIPRRKINVAHLLEISVFKKSYCYLHPIKKLYRQDLQTQGLCLYHSLSGTPLLSLTSTFQKYLREYANKLLTNNLPK